MLRHLVHEDQSNDDHSDGNTHLSQLVQIPSALLSLLCSLLIIVHAIRSKEIKIYHRLVIGLSFWDCISSSVVVLARILGVLGKTGSRTVACTSIGFTAISSAGCGVMYNGSLSMFCLLVVVFGKKDDTIVRYYEPFFHAIPLLCVFSITVAGLAFDSYNYSEGTNGCWLVAQENDSVAELLSSLILLEYLLATAFVIVCNVSVYIKVTRTIGWNSRFFSDHMKQKYKQTNDKKTRHVAVQSLLFCAGMLVSYFVGFVNQLIGEGHKGKWWYTALLFIALILYPLQGFFDALVYFRPRYIGWRKACREESYWFALKMTVLTTISPNQANLLHLHQSTKHNSGEQGSTLASGNSHHKKFSIWKIHTTESLSAQERNDDATSKGGSLLAETARIPAQGRRDKGEREGIENESSIEPCNDHAVDDSCEPEVCSLDASNSTCNIQEREQSFEPDSCVVEGQSKEVDRRVEQSLVYASDQDESNV
mmetsp:Transcript_32335/g.49444  ORF Transcript_32335/g.49444 Transcript_32335/m.49444 type:complete len:480 (+) Transcript_32335:29-1468(+)